MKNEPHCHRHILSKTIEEIVNQIKREISDVIGCILSTAMIQDMDLAFPNAVITLKVPLATVFQFQY